MANSNYATSREKGQPVDLFLFAYGETERYRYTSAEAITTYDGEDYVPLPIKRTRIEVKGKIEVSEVKVTVPRDSDIATLFVIYPPTGVVTLMVRQGNVPNASDPSEWLAGENFPVAWRGRVLESSRDGAEATLTCMSIASSMRRPGLQRNYQRPCPLVLYRQGLGECNANKAIATVTATVTAIAGNVVTVEPGFMPEGKTINDFLKGVLEWDGTGGVESRTILSVPSDTSFRLTALTRELLVNDEVRLILGCPHTVSGCENLHNNILNYGGHPWIPYDNPVNKNNHI